MKNNYGYYLYIDNEIIEIKNIENIENIEIKNPHKLSIFSIKYYIHFFLYIIRFIKNFLFRIIGLKFIKYLFKKGFRR
jgi:hypothetical protein